MARLPRIELPDIPQHIIQRGNNHSFCFGSNEDFSAYLYWLKEYSKKYCVDIHARVLMTNHVHLLCTPRKPKAISQLMQSLGRRYVQYFNYTYKRTGTLWEGRFKSCVIDEDSYLLHVYRYIELNPVRASMVTDPSDYIWSSYRINALHTSCQGINVYPNWTTDDWTGGPKTHNEENDLMVFDGNVYSAKWYTNSIAGSDNTWRFVESCN